MFFQTLSPAVTGEDCDIQYNRQSNSTDSFDKCFTHNCQAYRKTSINSNRSCTEWK